MYDFRTFSFGKGSHLTRDDGMCIMEAVAYVAGEEHSDHPMCACPVISTFLRQWNDNLPTDDRQRLLGSFVFRLVGTKATAKIEEKRGTMALRWLITVFTPAMLDLTPSLAEHAKKLRKLKISAKNQQLISAALSATNLTALSAAHSAALSAALSAAHLEAHSAALSAAHLAALSAALSATNLTAISAAYLAAYLADRSVTTLTIKKLQRSAQRLVDRMIRLTEPRERNIYAIEGREAQVQGV